LRRQGKTETTIDVYSRVVQRICAFFDVYPNRLAKSVTTKEDINQFSQMLTKITVETAPSSRISWATAKVRHLMQAITPVALAEKRYKLKQASSR